MAFNLGSSANTGKLNMSDFLGNSNTNASGNENAEKEKDIPIELLVPWGNQPFKAYSDFKLNELAESIKENGLLSKIIVSPMSDGRYRILAGHNRVEACKIAGMSSVPSVIMDVDESRAKLIMADTNLCQRQELLPSERVFAYKAQQEALIALGSSRATADIAEKYGVDRKTIQLYVSCSRLASELLNMLDEGRIALRTAASFSKMPQASQKEIAAYLQNRPNAAISAEQAQELSDLQFVTEADIAELYNEPKSEKSEEDTAPKQPKKSSPDAKKFAKKITLKRSEVTEIIGDELTNDEIAEFFYYCLQQKSVLEEWHRLFSENNAEPEEAAPQEGYEQGEYENEP